jgi:hypothetical protein
MYYFVCLSKACVKLAFRTSWELLAMGSMSSMMERVRKELSCFASAVRTVHTFLHPCASTDLSSIIAFALDLVLLAIFSTEEW